MLIVLVAWVYVIAMLSIALPSPVAGVLVFALVGCTPVGLIVWLQLLKHRGRREQRAEKLNADARPVEDPKS